MINLFNFDSTLNRGHHFTEHANLHHNFTYWTGHCKQCQRYATHLLGVFFPKFDSKLRIHGCKYNPWGGGSTLGCEDWKGTNLCIIFICTKVQQYTACTLLPLLRLYLSSMISSPGRSCNTSNDAKLFSIPLHKFVGLSFTM